MIVYVNYYDWLLYNVVKIYSSEVICVNFYDIVSLVDGFNPSLQFSTSFFVSTIFLNLSISILST